eukprot:3728314-Alexandrium_andersonii.AAC.1
MISRGHTRMLIPPDGEAADALSLNWARQGRTLRIFHVASWGDYLDSADPDAPLVPVSRRDCRRGAAAQHLHEKDTRAGR